MDALEIEKLKHRIDILVEKIENAKLQAGHAESIVVSERRQWDKHASDIKEIKTMIGEIREDMKSIDKILLNSGNGMVRDVDRLKEWKNDKDKQDDRRVPFWLQVLALILTFAAILVSIMKNT